MVGDAVVTPTAIIPDPTVDLLHFDFSTQSPSPLIDEVRGA